MLIQSKQCQTLLAASVSHLTMKTYLRQGDLEMADIYFPWFWRLQVSGQAAGMFGVWWGKTASWVSYSCCPHAVERKGHCPTVSFIRSLFFLRSPPNNTTSRSYHTGDLVSADELGGQGENRTFRPWYPQSTRSQREAGDRFFSVSSAGRNPAVTWPLDF